MALRQKKNGSEIYDRLPWVRFIVVVVGHHFDTLALSGTDNVMANLST